MGEPIGPLIILAVRLIIPLTIFKWPLYGGLLSLLADYFDLELINLINKGQFSNYQAADKMLDLYYLTFEAWVALHWQNLLAKTTALFLFLHRMIGTTVFEITKAEVWLFLFPNFFENFFLLYTAIIFAIKREPTISKKRLFILLFIISLPKLYQELFAHLVNLQPWPGSFN